jgi:uncharacterized damage-inducible protein DinB
MKTLKTPLLAGAAMLAVILLFAFRSSSENAVTTTTKLDAMIADWERAKSFTQDYLNASTDEVINFKPTPEMRTFGQQMLHLAEGNYALASAASGKASPVTFGQLEKSDQYKTKEAVTKAVMGSYDFVIAAIKETDPAKMGEMIKVFNFDLSRQSTLEKVFEHQTHHRGQTTVYLRLKGITPPNEKLF